MRFSSSLKLERSTPRYLLPHIKERNQLDCFYGEMLKNFDLPQRTRTATMRHFQQTNHSKNLERMFADYFDSKLFCDLTICCGGKNFEAHKLSLSISSPYLKNILQQDSTNHPIVYLPDVTPEEFEFVLEYCYKGKVLLPENKLLGFLKACLTLQIEPLYSEDATNQSEACILSDTDKESINNNESSTNNSAVSETEVKIKLNDRPILTEDSNGQRKDIRQRSSSSHVLVNSTENINILESPPSSISTIRRNNTSKLSLEIPQNENEPADKSPPSSPESFVFNLRTNLPVNVNTNSQSVVIVPQTVEVMEISSEEFAGEIKDIQPDASNINQDKSASEEEDFINIDDRPAKRAAKASDSDDSEIIIKRPKKNIKQKQLKVVLHKVELKETNRDSLEAQHGSVEKGPQLLPEPTSDEGDKPLFVEADYTTKVIDLKDVPEDKIKFYCHLCRRCVRAFYLQRHLLKHRLLD